MLKEEIKKIGILRANALGDFIVTLPAIKAIRNFYPQAELVLLGKPWHKNFLEESDGTTKRTPIDRVIVMPVTEGLREEPGFSENKKEVKNFCQGLSRENFDLFFNFHGKGLAANSFIKKIGAKITAGQICEGAEKLDYNLEYYYYQSEVIRYLEIISLTGIPPASLEPQIYILSKDHQEAKEISKKNNLSNFVAIHAAGTDIRRMWSEEKFAQLSELISQLGLQIVFTGSQPEESYIRSIISKMKYPAVNLAGQLSLGGLCAFLSSSKLVIAVDTGPQHLARACGAKTVGLYWAPNLINWGPSTRGTHRPVVSWKMECPQCGVVPNSPYPFEPFTSTCQHKFSFISSISVEEVMKEVNHLLKLDL